jgi:hypothetical protein
VKVKNTVFFFQDSGLRVKEQSSLNVVTEENVRGNNARKQIICCHKAGKSF